MHHFLGGAGVLGAAAARLRGQQSAQIKARRSYYVTLFFLDGNKRTHMGEKNGERGLAKVLTDSKSRSLKMIVRQVN